MIISKNHLQSICNYTEIQSESKPHLNISYMQMIESSNSEYKREIIKKNRDLAIDALLDEQKVEEYQNREQWGESFDQEGYVSTISPRIVSLNLNVNKYNNLPDLYDIVISKLESLTQNPMSVNNLSINNFDYTISNNPNISDYENFNQNSRKLITRIMMVSNHISMTSRMGPPKTMIVGKKVLDMLVQSPYFSNQVSGTGPIIGNLSGMSVIFSPKIKSNKIILIRVSERTDPGINLINNTSQNEYYLGETNGWENFIHWFDVI